jgi:hypothetical protein
MIEVIHTRGLMNLFAMRVCALSDATDDEILATCNRENPSGTERGWTEVVRVADDSSPLRTENKLPVKCSEHEGKMHFIVLC